MKKIATLLICVLMAQLSIAQVKVGQHVNNIALNQILNAPVSKTSLAGLKGKVIWLEFWATWCEPCVRAMPALQKLQKQYKGKLQIIAVSSETEKRLSQFIINRPSNLWFAVDGQDSFSKDYPFHTFPHSILINAQGIVVAITEPANITSEVIAKVIAGKPINLPLKQDLMVDNPWATYFPAADTVRSLFSVQPEIKGLGTAFKTYTKDTVFKNRRISMMNIDLESAYRIAYGDVPYNRIVDETPKADSTQNQALYCIDVIVPKGHEDELLPKLRTELTAKFDLRASFEKRLKTVDVLEIADAAQIAKLKRSSLTTEELSARHGSFSGKGVTLGRIGKYLESYGLIKIPVIDGTNDTNKYEIDFTFMPEKSGDLQQALLNLGLILKQEDRDIDVLVFR